jgi:hypothetical protein
MRHHPTTIPPHVVTCLCGKSYSPTKAAARQLRREIETYKGRHFPVRFYECRHGGWHWTRQVESVRTRMRSTHEMV